MNTHNKKARKITKTISKLEALPNELMLAIFYFFAHDLDTRIFSLLRVSKSFQNHIIAFSRSSLNKNLTHDMMINFIVMYLYMEFDAKLSSEYYAKNCHELLFGHIDNPWFKKTLNSENLFRIKTKWRDGWLGNNKKTIGQLLGDLKLVELMHDLICEPITRGLIIDNIKLNQVKKTFVILSNIKRIYKVATKITFSPYLLKYIKNNKDSTINNLLQTCIKYHPNLRFEQLSNNDIYQKFLKANTMTTKKLDLLFNLPHKNNCIACFKHILQFKNLESLTLNFYNAEFNPENLWEFLDRSSHYLKNLNTLEIYCAQNQDRDFINYSCKHKKTLKIKNFKYTFYYSPIDPTRYLNTQNSDEHLQTHYNSYRFIKALENNVENLYIKADCFDEEEDVQNFPDIIKLCKSMKTKIFLNFAEWTYLSTIPNQIKELFNLPDVFEYPKNRKKMNLHYFCLDPDFNSFITISYEGIHQ